MAMSTAAGSMSDLDQNGERPPASINGSEVLPKNDRIGKGESVAICAIAKEEEKYIVEWLDYYSGMNALAIICDQRRRKMERRLWLIVLERLTSERGGSNKLRT
eukprot:1324141-Amorphochlora_amoeboformis.AAC.2